MSEPKKGRCFPGPGGSPDCPEIPNGGRSASSRRPAPLRIERPVSVVGTQTAATTPISTEADGPERLARIPFATVVRATALRVFMIAAGRWLALGMAGRCVELGVIARAALVRDRVSLSTVAIVKEDARGAENRPQEEASCTEQGDW